MNYYLFIQSFHFINRNYARFICTDTIEERILAVQNNKMEISNSALTGEKTKSGNKLTLNELKSLFDMH